MPKKNTTTRPPIITVLGHVDHGKTTLLDAIRHTHVAEKEHGGITQHIGAYQIEHQDKLFTFIDTPGHAAFSKMRARGANITDIVILVVAADDGVKPQTVESIRHIHEAKVPLVVAINKMDAPGASPDMVKAQLTEHQIFCEGYGGQTPAVEISAKNATGIDQLLEIIGLMAEMEELSADPAGPLDAVIIESQLEKNRGPLGTAIIKNGTLSTAQTVYLGTEPVKFRAMFDDKGKNVSQAEPGKPVELLGFKTVPPVGSVLTSTPQETTPTPTTDPSAEPTSPETEGQDISINLILKADTAGTLEAIIQNLAQEITLISTGIGPISESDVLMAQTTSSTIIGFNVPVSSSAKKLARIEKIKILTFNIIYDLLEFLEEKVLKLIEPTIDEEELGSAQVVSTFDIKGSHIAGCRITSGKITVDDKLHLVREGKVVTDLKIKSLKFGKDDIKVAKSGSECGMIFHQKVDTRPGDVIQSYRIKE